MRHCTMHASPTNHSMPRRRETQARRFGLAIVVLLLLVPVRLGAQRLVPSRPWPADAKEWAAKIQLVADSSIAPEASREASHAGIIFRTVVGFRADSLLVEITARDSSTGSYRATDTLAVPAAAVLYVDVRTHDRRQARTATAGESAMYLAMVGALVGVVVGKTGHRGRSAGVGAGIAAGAGLVGGALFPYHDYGYRWHRITFRVEPNL